RRAPCCETCSTHRPGWRGLPWTMIAFSPRRASFWPGVPPPLDSLTVPVSGLLPPTEMRCEDEALVPPRSPGQKISLLLRPSGSQVGGISSRQKRATSARPPSRCQPSGTGSSFASSRSMSTRTSVSIPSLLAKTGVYTTAPPPRPGRSGLRPRAQARSVRGRPPHPSARPCRPRAGGRRRAGGSGGDGGGDARGAAALAGAGRLGRRPDGGGQPPDGHGRAGAAARRRRGGLVPATGGRLRPGQARQVRRRLPAGQNGISGADIIVAAPRPLAALAEIP